MLLKNINFKAANGNLVHTLEHLSELEAFGVPLMVITLQIQ